MLSPIKIQQIRNLYNQNKSIKSIVRTLKLSRNTVRKYISLDETTTHKTRKVSEAKLFLETNKMHIHALFIMHKYYCVPLKRTIFEKYGIDIHLRMLQKFCKPFRLNKFPKKSPIRPEVPVNYI